MGWASRYREYQAEQKSRFEGDDYGAEPAPSGLPFGMTGAQVAVLGLGAIFLATVFLEKRLKEK